MKTYLRILKYVKPYWKHLLLSIVCTILFALLNGVSIYLTIPLLDTLFQQDSTKKEVVSQIPAVDKTIAILPDWIIKMKDGVATSFNNFVFSGDKTHALFSICLLVLVSFLLKNIFGYLQAYFLAYTEY